VEYTKIGILGKAGLLSSDENSEGRILMKRYPLTFILALLFLFSSSGQIFAQASGLPTKTRELLSRGKKLYEQNCVPCHGEKGDGKRPAGAALKPSPQDFKLPYNQWPYSKGGLKKTFEVISKGIPNTGMVKWDFLPEGDRWALVYYVTAFAARSKVPAKKK
jgi:mono/diheme cytochrome c family protein